MARAHRTRWPLRHATVLAVTLVVAAACSRFEGAVTIEREPTTTIPFARPQVAAPTTAVEEVTTTAARPTMTAPAGQPVPEALRLGEGGLGRARFGTDADEAVGYVVSVLGPPDEDSLWDLPDTAYGPCPGTEARTVRWGWLLVILTDRSPFGAGRRHFAGWRYGPEVDPDALYPEGLAFLSGIGPGSTWAQVEAAHPGAVRAPADGRFTVGTSFSGLLDGYAPESTVVRLDAGSACLDITS